MIDPNRDPSDASSESPEKIELESLPEMGDLDIGPALENGEPADSVEANGLHRESEAIPPADLIHDSEASTISPMPSPDLSAGAEQPWNPVPEKIGPPSDYGAPIASGFAPAMNNLETSARANEMFADALAAGASTDVDATSSGSADATRVDGASESLEPAAAETAPTEPAPGEPPTDPVFLDAIARDLDDVRTKVADLRARWEAQEHAKVGEHAALQNAIVATENEFYALVDRLRPAAAPADEFALAPAEPLGEKKEGFKFDEAPAAGMTKSVSATPRPPKEQPSMLREMIGIVLGGVFAIPIAQLILWWLGRDPLDLGPKMPDALKFLVPAQFQGESTATPTPTPAPTPTKNFQMDKFNTPMGEPEIIGGPTTPTPEPMVPAPTPMPPMEKKPPTLAPAPVPMAESKHPVKNAPAIRGNDLGKALGEADVADKAVAAEKDAEKSKPLFRQQFIAHCALADALAYVDRESNAEQIPSRVIGAEAQISKLAENAAVVERLGRYSGSWLRNPAGRANSGVILAGRLVSVEKQGKLTVAKVELLEPQKLPVTILTTNPIEDPVDSIVVVAGSIVKEPAANVSGYQGGEPEAVWLGAWAVVAGASPPQP